MLNRPGTSLPLTLHKLCFQVQLVPLRRGRHGGGRVDGPQAARSGRGRRGLRAPLRLLTRRAPGPPGRVGTFHVTLF